MAGIAIFDFCQLLLLSSGMLAPAAASQTNEGDRSENWAPEVTGGFHPY
jgi:hypothetical protein